MDNEKYSTFGMVNYGFRIVTLFIGEFLTKEEAISFGKYKKAKGNIEDFYVLPNSKIDKEMVIF